MGRFRYFLLLSSLICGLISVGQFAFADETTEAFKLYLTNDFEGAKALALKTLDSKPNTLLASKLYYLLGLIEKRKENYEKALEAFKKVEQVSTLEDFFYEIGQTHYALNNLQEAISFFQKSLNQNFKKDSSLYYMAYCYQLLEEFRKAQNLYEEIIAGPKYENALKQASLYQIIEIMLTKLEGIPERDQQIEILNNNIFPIFEKLTAMDENSSVAKDGKEKLQKVKEKYGLDPNTLKNGKKIPAKRYRVTFVQKINYDSNVNQIASIASNQGVTKDAFILDSSLTGKYDFYIDRQFIVKTSLNLNNAYHLRRNVPAIYTNDSFTISPSAGFYWEHLFLGKFSSLGLDLTPDYKVKDIDSNKSLKYYTSSFKYAVSYNFRFYDQGTTTLKIGQKFTKNTTSSQSNHSLDISLVQTHLFSNQHLFIGFLSASFLKGNTLRSVDSNTFVCRFDYIVPKILWDLTLNLNHTFTLTNPMEARPTRGLEPTFSPGLSLTKIFTELFRIGFNYTFASKSSKLDSSKYTKHTVGLDFTLNY